MERIMPCEVVAAYAATGLAPVIRLFRVPILCGTHTQAGGCALTAVGELRDCEDDWAQSATSVAGYYRGFANGWDHSPGRDDPGSAGVGWSDGRAAWLAVGEAYARGDL